MIKIRDLNIFYGPPLLFSAVYSSALSLLSHPLSSFSPYYSLSSHLLLKCFISLPYFLYSQSFGTIWLSLCCIYSLPLHVICSLSTVSDRLCLFLLSCSFWYLSICNIFIFSNSFNAYSTSFNLYIMHSLLCLFLQPFLTFMFFVSLISLSILSQIIRSASF